MKITFLSDLHIGKWNNYGHNLIEKASGISGDILWLNGDIIEPGVSVDEDSVFLKLGKLRDNYNHVVWVAGNNCLELDCVSGPIKSYAENFSEVLRNYGIHLMDNQALTIGDYAFIGSIGWSNGELWAPSIFESEQPNDPTACNIAAEKFFSKKFGERWTITSQQLNKLIRGRLDADIDAALFANKKIVLGTHYATSKEFCLFGDNARYDYLNWYMGFDGSDMYRRASPIMAVVGHTHRRATINIGGTPVYNVSGAKEPVVFNDFRLV